MEGKTQVNLTTERLDELAALAYGVVVDPTIGGRLGHHIFGLEMDDLTALIDAARMGVAWAECEALGGHVVEVSRIGPDHYRVFWKRSENRRGMEVVTAGNYDGPTPTAALLALRDALRNGSDVSQNADE
jgi:hypothetical protein